MALFMDPFYQFKEDGRPIGLPFTFTPIPDVLTNTALGQAGPPVAAKDTLSGRRGQAQ